eukprot:5017977-Pyramimonas_sp.AAC.1
MRMMTMTALRTRRGKSTRDRRHEQVRVSRAARRCVLQQEGVPHLRGVEGRRLSIVNGRLAALCESGQGFHFAPQCGCTGPAGLCSIAAT